MTLDLLSIKLDREKLDDGTIWIISVEPDGSLLGTITGSIPEKEAWIKVRAPNIAFRRAQDLARKPHLKAIRKGEVSDDLEAEIQGEALCVLVVGWGNMTRDGVDIPCNEGTKRMLLTDREWTNFSGLVDSIANNRQALLESTIKESEGNSSAGLNGPSESSTLVGDKSS